jgi:DNA-binding transcriptional LysR family regulator
MNQRIANSGLAAAGLIAVAAGAGAAAAAETVTYSYDARGRLVQVARIGTVNNNVVTAYTLDKAHNRTAKTTTGSANPGPP